jgi:hypothetical protein
MAIVKLEGLGQLKNPVTSSALKERPFGYMNYMN